MRYASIDIGTNTILMLIGDVDGETGINPVKDFYSVPRIGKSVSATKKLDGESMQRALDVLAKYREAAGAYGVDRVVASATSAVREAANRDEFVSRVKESCGIDVEVIGGDVEAKLGFLGAVSGVSDRSVPSLVIDIGGGSTEFSFGTGVEPKVYKSIDVGAVRVTEKFFRHNPPTDAELVESWKFIQDSLRRFPFSSIRPGRVFAAAGTATTLALIAQKKYEFDQSAVNNYRMTVLELSQVIDLIRRKTPDEIRALTEAAEGRSDVLLAGALILRKSLEAARVNEFLATDRGLRYGYLLFKHMQSTGK